MKTLKRIGVLLAVTLGFQLPGIAQVFNQTDNTVIPDNDLNGLAESLTINTSIQSISSLQVSLDIAGGFNGDYYVYLTHGDGFSVLLNRVGATAGNPYGYADSGLDVTFSDNAANGNIHNYQFVDNPNGGTLTGTWQPDGRTADPNSVLDTSPSSAFLSSFDGLDPNGTWTLYIADCSPGGVGDLQSWAIDINGSQVGGNVPGVPDVFSTFFLLGLCCGIMPIYAGLASDRSGKMKFWPR